jgi:hypothetical protein
VKKKSLDPRAESRISSRAMEDPGFRSTKRKLGEIKVISHRPAVAKAMARQAHPDPKDKNFRQDLQDRTDNRRIASKSM